MSLYDSISKTLSTKGLSTAIGEGTDSALSGLKGTLGNSPLGNAVVNIGTSMARNAAVNAINKFVPASMQRIISSGTGALGDVMNGNFSNAGLRVLDSGILSDLIPGMDGIGSQMRFWGTPTPLFGGITPEEARSIYKEQISNEYCRKNLFLIEVSSFLGGDISSVFNMLATDIEYSSPTISGEKRKIGAAHVDLVNSSDPTELRITTFDDINGTIKSWFKAHAEACAFGNGTVGLPIDYAIKIKVVHGFVTQGSNYGGYEDIGLYRPAGMDVSLSRKESALQELQLSFMQLDTFMAH